MDPKIILVIEDDDTTRESFGSILSQHGYNVALARSGQEGLEYLQTHNPPDLIILDMFLPGMDGWQFLKYKAARWRSVPVLVTTALSVASDEWVESLGACGWVKKPIEPAELVLEVTKCFATAQP
jgi:CheY-like chemotaxis protein